MEDFCCPMHWLVKELDGPQDGDKPLTRWLRARKTSQGPLGCPSSKFCFPPLPPPPPSKCCQCYIGSRMDWKWKTIRCENFNAVHQECLRHAAKFCLNSQCSFQENYTCICNVWIAKILLEKQDVCCTQSTPPTMSIPMFQGPGHGARKLESIP